MQNYSISAYNTNVTQSYSGYTKTSETTSQQVRCSRVIFTCTNGTKTGDRVTPTPYSFRKTTSVSGPLSSYTRSADKGHWSYTSTSGRASDNLEGAALVNSYFTSQYGALRDRCMEKIYDQIRGNSNVIVDLAESSATLRMLRSTLNLKKFATEFFTNVVKERSFPRSRKKRNSVSSDLHQKRLDYMTSKWLEYRYGWSPLVYSIYDAADNILSSRVARLCAVKGRSGTSGKVFLTKGQYETGYTTELRTHKERVEVCAIFDLDDQKKIYDWTSLNPLAIAWELTPLSFVADWVINVSQQLDLLENRWLFASRFKGGYVTHGWIEERQIRREQLVNRSLGYSSSGTPNSGVWYSTRTESVNAKNTSKSRALLTTLPGPSGFRLNVKLGAKRQLDAAALVHQVFVKNLRH